MFLYFWTLLFHRKFFIRDWKAYFSPPYSLFSQNIYPSSVCRFEDQQNSTFSFSCMTMGNVVERYLKQHPSKVEPLQTASSNLIWHVLVEARFSRVCKWYMQDVFSSRLKISLLWQNSCSSAFVLPNSYSHRKKDIFMYPVHCHNCCLINLKPSHISHLCSLYWILC